MDVFYKCNLPRFPSVCHCSVIKLSPPENDLFYDIVAVVDPLTRGAQKMAQLLVVRQHDLFTLKLKYS